MEDSHAEPFSRDHSVAAGLRHLCQCNFTFFSAANAQVGTLAVRPALGSSPAIFAQDIVLAAPLNVRYVRAFLTGSNGQVHFQNIGFTADVSGPSPNPTPEPGTLALAAPALVAAMRSRRRG